jgi:hypothetical protein
MNFVVVVGNPFDGLLVYGSFDGAVAAVEWAREMADDSDRHGWWVVEMLPVVDAEPVVPDGVKATALAPEWEDG